MTGTRSLRIDPLKALSDRATHQVQTTPEEERAREKLLGLDFSPASKMARAPIKPRRSRVSGPEEARGPHV